MSCLTELSTVQSNMVITCDKMPVPPSTLTESTVSPYDTTGA